MAQVGTLALAAVAEASPLMLWAAGPDRRREYFNPRWLSFTGRGEGQEAGLGWMEGVHPEDRVRVLRRYERAFERREAFALEYRLRRADGEWRTVIDQGAPYFEDGEFRGYVGGCAEIESIKLIERQLERELERCVVEKRRLALRLVDAQDAERRRLSSEIHDRAGEALTALRLQLGILADALGPDSQEARDRLLECVRRFEVASEALTEVMAALWPPMLDAYGLASSLRWYGQEFARQTGIDVRLSLPEDEPRVPHQVEIALYRIAQEGLRNVARHSGATHVQLTLEQKEGSVTLRIKDNGKGFLASAQPHRPPRRWGVSSMRERAEAVGGELEIESSAGKGVCVTAKVGVS